MHTYKPHNIHMHACLCGQLLCVLLRARPVFVCLVNYYVCFYVRDLVFCLSGQLLCMLLRARPCALFVWSTIMCAFTCETVCFVCLVNYYVCFYVRDLVLCLSGQLLCVLLRARPCALFVWSTIMCAFTCETLCFVCLVNYYVCFYVRDLVLCLSGQLLCVLLRARPCALFVWLTIMCAFTCETLCFVCVVNYYVCFYVRDLVLCLSGQLLCVLLRARPCALFVWSTIMCAFTCETLCFVCLVNYYVCFYVRDLVLCLCGQLLCVLLRARPCALFVWSTIMCAFTCETSCFVCVVNYYVCFYGLHWCLILSFFYLFFFQLQASCKKFESLETSYKEVHDWVTSVNDIMSKFTIDAGGEHIDEFRVSLEVHTITIQSFLRCIYYYNSEYPLMYILLYTTNNNNPTVTNMYFPNCCSKNLSNSVQNV